MAEQEGSVKSAMIEVMTALMSGNPDDRKLAEQQLDALQVTEGMTSHILHFCVPDQGFYVLIVD